MSLDQGQVAPPELVLGASARSAPSSPGEHGSPDPAAIRISEVSKAFGHGHTAVLALGRLSLDVALGEFVCLTGASGCGLSRLSLYRHLILPASLPSFVAGLKQSWAFAWRSLMAGELLVIIIGQPSIAPCSMPSRISPTWPARSRSSS